MRTYELELPVDTRMFGPAQMLPRKLLSYTMTAFAGWLRAHAVAFPTLVRDYHTGVVIVGHHLRFERAFTFLDAESFSLRAGRLVACAGGALLTQRTELVANGEVFASSEGVGRVVRMDDGGAMSARPGVLPEPVLDLFLADERADEPPPRRMPPIEPEGGEVIGSGVHPLRMERRDCEVAEQWSYVEAVSHSAAARATVALAAGGDPRLKRGLRSPLTAVDVSYQRPMFVFDRGAVQTTAWRVEDELVWSHVIGSELGGGTVHATVVERHAL